MERFIRKVYDGFDSSDGFEPLMWREVLRIVNEATVSGLADAQTPVSHEEDFYRALRHSNEVFAAFKVHDLADGMAARLLDDKGRLKPFRLWREEVRPLAAHHVGAWLRTEYDTAVIRAHNAADWRRFLRDKDVMPNLRWMPTTSPNPESSHREFWAKRLTLPVDDPFWLSHHPGDRWNCKCSLEQTDEPATPELKSELDGLKPQRGLENNTGVDGHVFSDSHPYFPDACARCAFYKPSIKDRLTTLFHNRKKDCYNCPYINACIDRANAKQTTDNKTFAKRANVIDNDLMPKLDKAICTEVISGVLNRTKKVRNRLLKHCRHDYDVDAAVFIWNNPQKLVFDGTSPIGEGKDLNDPEVQANIQRKKDRGVVEYMKYHFQYGGKIFLVKLEKCKKGYEQFYSIMEK